MYRALYRKWRPQTFNDVVGQQAITTALQNQIIAGKVGHAYLFTGTRGTGKTSCAKIFAKAVNCENRHGGNPCGTCVPCQGLDDGSILDVIEIDAASNNGVDDIRDLRDETAYRPSRCQYKVYIIDEVHMLSTAAFNALLKTMEEPPSHVIFILATTEIHKVPATILSRCQRYDFMRIAAESIAGRLHYVAEQEGITLSDNAADLIARLADGAMRDALSLLDTCAGVGGDINEELVRRMAGVTDRTYLFAVSRAVTAGNATELLQLVAQLREQSIDVKRLCEELVHHYRNYLLAAAMPNGGLLQNLPVEDRAQYLQPQDAVGTDMAVEAIRRLAKAMDRMGRSPDPRIELELALLDLSIRRGAVQAAQQPVQAQAAAAMPNAAAAGVTPAQPAMPVAPQGAAQPVTTSPAAPVEPVPVAAAPVAPVPDAPPPAANGVEPPPARDEDAPPWDDAPPPPPQEAPPVPPATFQPAAPVASPQSVPPAMAGTVSRPPANAAPAAAQKAAPPGAPPVFEPWAQVVAGMALSDKMLYNFMKSSSAYLEGNRVLIDGGDMFLTYMRQYEGASESIKNAIEQVSGKRYAIGPYKGACAQDAKVITAKDTLQAWQQKGVAVEIISDNEGEG